MLRRVALSRYARASMSGWKSLLVAIALTTLGCGASGPRAVAAGQPAAGHVTVDLNDIYWVTSDGRSSALMKAFKEEDRPAVQVSTIPGTVEALAVDDDGLYLVVAGTQPGASFVRKIPKRKSLRARDLISARTHITSIALDATHVYFTQAGPGVAGDDSTSPGVLRVMRTGGTPFNLAMGQPGEPRNITTSAAHVFWVNVEPGGKNAIMSVRKGGGAPVRLALVPDSETNGPPALAADDASVYYKTRTAVVRIPADGGKPEPFATVSDSDCHKLLIDARALYFLSPRGPVRLDLQTRTTRLIGNGPGTDLAIDDRFAYWVWNGSVMQAPKAP